MVVVEYEAVWIKQILKDLGVSINELVLIYYDNFSRIHLARKPLFHARTTDIEVHYHFIRERFIAGDVDLQHIRTNLQTVDIFTKSLGIDKFRLSLVFRSTTCRAWEGVIADRCCDVAHRTWEKSMNKGQNVYVQCPCTQAIICAHAHYNGKWRARRRHTKSWGVERKREERWKVGERRKQFVYFLI